MVQDDSTAPATKEDIRLIMEQIGNLHQSTHNWKEEIIEHMDNWSSEMMGKMDIWKKELKEHFDLVTENQLYDFKGIFKDRTEDHDRRIKRLEQKTGIAA